MAKYKSKNKMNVKKLVRPPEVADHSSLERVINNFFWFVCKNVPFMFIDFF